MIPAIASAVHALGAQAAISPLGSVGSVGSVSETAPTGDASFGSALTSAVGSLNQSQQTATVASQALADGTATDPTQAVTAVENASLTMDLAAQVRDKLVGAEQTLFATQV